MGQILSLATKPPSKAHYGKRGWRQGVRPFPPWPVRTTPEASPDLRGHRQVKRQGDGEAPKLARAANLCGSLSASDLGPDRERLRQLDGADPIRLDHVGALKRLSTEERDFEDSQQTIDPAGKDAGNCKLNTPQQTTAIKGISVPPDDRASFVQEIAAVREFFEPGLAP